MWSNAFDFQGFDDEGFSVAITSDGYVICGTVGIDGAGQTKAGVVRTNASGEMIWKKTIGRTANSSETARGIVVLSSGDMILGGSTTDIDVFKYGANTEGGKAINPADTHDFYWTKIASDGTIIWQKALGFRGMDRVADIVLNTVNGTEVIGVLGQKDTIDNSRTQSDLFLYTLNIDGNPEAAYLSETREVELANSLAVTDDGGYMLLGTVNNRTITLHKRNKQLAGRIYSKPIPQ